LAQPPRALPRRYWFQAATNRPTKVTGIKPSTMPQSRGSIIGDAGRVDVGSFFHDGSLNRDASPPSVTAGSANAPMSSPAESLPPIEAAETTPAPSRLVKALILLAASASLVLALLLLGASRSDPYTKATLDLVGSEQTGGRLFRLNCAGCHGLAAQGLVGPDLHGVSRRKNDRRLIQQVVSGSTPPMPRFQPEPQAMADLLAFLHSLPN